MTNAAKNRPCTIRDIAEYAQVSRSTVSRVLNNVRTKVPVSESTRERIAEAIRHFDYTPNENARRLSVNRSFVIGLQVPAHAPGSYVFTDYNLIGAMHGIESAIVPSGFRLQILFQSTAGNGNSEALQLLKNKSIDGLLVWGALRNEQFHEELRNYPVILLNSLPDAREGFSTISHDDYAGSYALTKKLLEAGARRFFYVGGPENVSICLEREKGFLDALSSFAIPFHPERDFQRGNFMFPDGYKLMKSLMARGGAWNYDAVICVNDMMATGVYEAACEGNLRPQRDFLLAGADGVEDCSRYCLWTYKCDRFDLGLRGVKELIRMIDSGDLEPIRTRIAPLPPALNETKQSVPGQ